MCGWWCVLNLFQLQSRGAVRDKPGHGDTWGGDSDMKPIYQEDPGSPSVLHFLEYHTAEPGQVSRSVCGVDGTLGQETWVPDCPVYTTVLFRTQEIV